MPPRQDEQKITVADRDRMIVELGHEIALNPKDATVYRKRGFLFGQNSHYDHAIADFDRVLALNPSDGGAYFLRGVAWHRKHDPKRAIADYDKAIEFDPANEKFYREHREKAAHDAQAVHAPASTGAQNTASASAKGLTGFFKRLA